MKRPFLIIFFVLGLLSCHKETVEPTYTAQYRFINEGDGRVMSLSMYTTTTFPKEDKACDFSDTYPRISAYDTVVKVIEGPYAYPAYRGCTTWMRVVIHFNEPVYSPLRDRFATKGTWFRAYEVPVDTIRRAEDASITFRWPSDTLRYREIPW